MEIDVRGSIATYAEYGGGRPIVVLHGRPADHRQMVLYFEPVFAGRPGWRRIYPDLPGMGGTPGPGWISSHGGMVEWTIACLDALAGAGEPITLAGSSYGAWLALQVLERQPERLEGLLLVAPAVRLDLDEGRLPPRRIVKPGDPGLMAEVGEDEQAWLGVSVVQTRETLEGFRRGTKPGFAAADHVFQSRLVLDAGATSGPPAAPFDRPTLILTGRQDHLVGYADALDLIESFPRATIAVLDRAGHGVANEQRGLFKALVGEWLDRVEEASDG